MKQERTIPEFLSDLHISGIAGLELSPGEYLDVENSTISALEVARLNDYAVRRFGQIVKNISRRCRLKKVDVVTHGVAGYWQVRVFNKNITLLDFVQKVNDVVQSSPGKIDYGATVLELIGKCKIEFYYALAVKEESKNV